MTNKLHWMRGNGKNRKWQRGCHVSQEEVATLWKQQMSHIQLEDLVKNRKWQKWQMSCIQQEELAKKRGSNK